MHKTKLELQQQKSLLQHLNQQNSYNPSPLSKNIIFSHKKKSLKTQNYHINTHNHNSELFNKQKIYDLRNKLKNTHNDTKSDKDNLFFDVIKSGINIQSKPTLIPFKKKCNSQHTNKTKKLEKISRYRFETQNPQSINNNKNSYITSTATNKNVSLNNIITKIPNNQIVAFNTIENKNVKDNNKQVSINIIKNNEKKIKLTTNNTSIKIKTNNKINLPSKIGQSKKLSQKLQKLSVKETMLQLQIFKQHKQTKDFISLVKSKYNLNFNKQKTYLKDHIKQLKYSLPQLQLHQGGEGQGVDNIFKIEAECQHLMYQLNRLDILLKEKSLLQEVVVSQIDNNSFQIFLDNGQELPKHIIPVISQEEEDPQTQAKTQLMQKLKKQLDRIRQYNNNNISYQQSQPNPLPIVGNSTNTKMLINDRLKDLIF